MKERTDQEIIEELRNLSGHSIESITEIFKFFSVYSCLCYINDEKIKIPFFGDFLLKYDGDEITAEGKEAQVTGFFSPHDELKRMVGQTEDAKNRNDKESYSTINVVDYLMNRLEDVIRREIE